MASITLTFHYEPNPAHYPEGFTVEEMVELDVESFKDGAIDILDIEDMAYKMEFKANPHDK